MNRRVLLSALGLAALAAACLDGEAGRAPGGAALGSGEAQRAAAPTQIGAPAPMLPVDAVRFPPSQVEILGRGSRTGHELADVERCDGCHAGVVASFEKSAHAHASFSNPLYRAAVDRFRAERGRVQSRLCGSCHDPALLVDDALDHEVEPEDPRAYAGVSCSVCHSIVEVRPGGNGSYTLDDTPIPIPDLDDPESIRVHRARVRTPPVNDGSVCTACHKVFLDAGIDHPHFMSGVDDVLPMRRSPYAGSHAERVDRFVAPASCRDCHMKLDEATDFDVAAHDGLLASHGVRGGHTMLAAMRDDHAEVERIAEVIRRSVSVDALLARMNGRELDPLSAPPSPEPGDRVEVDVVVKNLGVGHKFPGGTIDIADTWIEAELVDAEGRVLAESGIEHEQSGDDVEAHRLRGLLIDDRGEPLEAHQVERFRALAYDHTVGPRDSRVVGYAFTVPERGSYVAPLELRARLRFRARVADLTRTGCEAQRSARGQAFRERSGLDACVTAPVSELGEARVVLGATAAPGAGAALGDRLADHGRGLLQAVQEELELARPSLAASLELALAEGDALGAARALHLIGELDGRAGRTEDALASFARAEAYAPGHPALAYGRGRALAQVWRFDEARVALDAASLGAPKDELAWAALAMARGSSGDHLAALEAARRGLALAPRQPDLLRVQALSLRALDPGSLSTAQADHEHLEHRSADAFHELRRRCSDHVPGCARERKPVHVHELRPRR